MGDNFLEGQVKNSRKRRDRAMVEMQLPSLFKRPENVRQVFPVRPADGVALQEGEELLAVRTGGDTRIDVARDYRQVGFVEGEAAKALAEALELTGAAKLRIGKVSPLSGFGQAEIVKD